MCGVCGCGEGEGKVVHAHHHHHEQEDKPNHRQGDTRLVEIERNLLAANDNYARQNRELWLARATLALNLVSSPGSGKTTLLVRTIEMLKDRLPIAVIEGDQQTNNDAERIRATGAPAVQLNTGKGCHLDAHMVGHALEHLPNLEGGVLYIENVGNLVCPAAFDLGEAARVVVLSVTEGEDKPLKYPDIFAGSQLTLINKTDLAEPCEVDLDAYCANIRRINPRMEILQLSARSGEGMDAWCEWVIARRTLLAHSRLARPEMEQAIAGATA